MHVEMFLETLNRRTCAVSCSSLGLVGARDGVGDCGALFRCGCSLDESLSVLFYVGKNKSDERIRPCYSHFLHHNIYMSQVAEQHDVTARTRRLEINHHNSCQSGAHLDQGVPE
jgi:hypothetical protein